MDTIRQSVSVALAAYNGEMYIKDQIDSILCQLNSKDELVISLDPSTDQTREIIEKIQKEDSRVKLIEGPGQGLIKNFENAIGHTRNEIIFLSDQDDIWKSDKINCVLEVMKDENILCTLHDAQVVDQDLSCIQLSVFGSTHPSLSFLKNSVKNSFMGCCMAFRKQLKKEILPFPEKIPMHDQWIGLIALKKGKVTIINRTLIDYRRHGNNESKMEHSSIAQMIRWRIDLFCALKERRII